MKIIRPLVLVYYMDEFFPVSYNKQIGRRGMAKEHINENVSKRLKNIRNNLNLTQEQFAELLDISIQTYKNMESEKGKISMNTLRKMKSKLDFSTDYLLFDENSELEYVWTQVLTLTAIEKQILLLRLLQSITSKNAEAMLKDKEERYLVLLNKIMKLVDDKTEDEKNINS